MPLTKGFLNPKCGEEWRDYFKFRDTAFIITETEKSFQYPVIAKMNKGTQGKCVFMVHNANELATALNHIYSEDYVALIQEYINITRVYKYKERIPSHLPEQKTYVRL